MKVLNLDKLKSVLVDACYIEDIYDLSPSITGLLNITKALFDNPESWSKENLIDSCKSADELIKDDVRNEQYIDIYEFIVYNAHILKIICSDEKY